MLFSATGWRLASVNRLPSLRAAAVLMMGGLAMISCEWCYLVKRLGVSDPIRANLGTVPLAVGVFLLSLRLPRFGRHIGLSRLVPLTLGIYMVHLLMLGFLKEIPRVVSPVVWDTCIVPVAFAISAGIVWLLQRTRITAILVDGFQPRRPNASQRTASVSFATSAS